MKLKRSQKLMLVLIILAVILAVTAAAVAFSGAGPVPGRCSPGAQGLRARSLI